VGLLIALHVHRYAIHTPAGRNPKLYSCTHGSPETEKVRRRVEMVAPKINADSWLPSQQTNDVRPKISGLENSKRHPSSVLGPQKLKAYTYRKYIKMYLIYTGLIGILH